MFLSKHATGMPCGRGGGDYAGLYTVGSVRGEGGILWGRAQWVPSAAREIMRGCTQWVPSAAGGFMDVT